MSVMRPELIMKSIIPVVMAGIIAIYGLVVAVLIAGALEKPEDYPLYKWVKKIFIFPVSILSHMTNGKKKSMTVLHHRVKLQTILFSYLWK